MRKKSIKKAAEAFSVAVDDTLSFIDELEQKTVSAKARSWAYEYAIIRLYRDFETLMLESIVAGINNDTSVLSSKTGIKFPKHLTDEVCEYIVTGDGYFDFRGRDGLIKTLKSFLADNHFLVVAVKDTKYKDALERLSALRNYAAHDSPQSKEAAKRAVDQDRISSAGSWLKKKERFADICENLKKLATAVAAAAKH